MNGATMLSDAAHSVWAKSSFSLTGELEKWSSLPLHSLDTGAVAERVFDQWLTAGQWHILACNLSDNYSADQRLEACKALTIFLATCHDFGKCTPVFSCKVPELDAVMSRQGLKHHRISEIEADCLPHGITGHILLREWLIGLGWLEDTAESVASVIGGHHGIPPSGLELDDALGLRHLFGDKRWQCVQDELLNWAASQVGLEKGAEFHDLLKEVHWSQSALVLLQGVVIMSDWIASSEDFFPIFPVNCDDPRRLVEDSQLHRLRADFGWRQVELPPPWEPDPSFLEASDALRARFDVPRHAVARPIQRKAIELARTIPYPGLLILEDVMGSGKTEAGLLAAEILADRTNASGITVVLPTQAMTDSMFARVLPWLDKLFFDTEVPSYTTVNLIHSRSKLNRGSFEVSSLPENETNRHIVPDCLEVRNKEDIKNYHSSSGHNYVTCNPWLYKKKAMLADFVVSTIDQLLMVALRSRHLALRHLGVSRKVVIIDEVHAVDTYMAVYLQGALKWLASYGIPVIALSATLSPSLKRKLLSAYEEGIPEALRQERQNRQEQLSETGDSVDTDHLSRDSEDNPQLIYPSISFSNSGQFCTMAVQQAFASHRVLLERLSSEDLMKQVDELMEDGGCLLILRNTVRSAQDTYRNLVDKYGSDVRLMHARFVAQHRSENDEWLRTNFGPPKETGGRPERSIVVATQVAEQSLDIDFDAIITDLAPIDLLFQRIGRVHRHSRNSRPPAMSTPRCFILDMPELSDENPHNHRTISSNVYPAILLLRTAYLINKAIPQGVLIPDDIAKMTYWVYDDKEQIPELWARAYGITQNQYDQFAIGEEERAKAFRIRDPGKIEAGLVEWLDGAPKDLVANARAQVRGGDESIEVILVEEIEDVPSSQWKILNGIGQVNSNLLHRGGTLEEDQARAMAGSMVKLPAFFSKYYRIKSTLNDLCFCPAWNMNDLVGGYPILPLKKGEVRVLGNKLRYSREMGLEEIL